MTDPIRPDQPTDAPDIDCYTLPDGSCIAPVCRLHDPEGGRTALYTARITRLLDENLALRFELADAIDQRDRLAATLTRVRTAYDKRVTERNEARALADHLIARLLDIHDVDPDPIPWVMPAAALTRLSEPVNGHVTANVPQHALIASTRPNQLLSEPCPHTSLNARDGLGLVCDVCGAVDPHTF